jgi:LuxR family maltose regulon positive regulatory protein
MALGEMEKASALLERGFPHHLQSGNHYLVLATLGRAAAIRAQTSGVAEALESVAAAMAFAREHGLENNPALSIVHLHAGWTHLLAAALDEADAAFETAMRSAPGDAFPEERGNALVGRACVALARGDIATAEGLLLQVAALGQAANVDLFDTTLELERLRLAAHRHSAEVHPAISQLLATLEDDAEPWTVLSEAAAILALQSTVQGTGDGPAPDSLSRRLIDESRPRQRGPALVSGLLARAITAEESERWASADEAIALISARGYLQPLVQLGAEAVTLLRAAARQPRLSKERRREAGALLERLPRLPDQDAEASPAEPGGVARSTLDLTSREWEVLDLVFTGITNKELARDLFVSVDTVKTHLKHIYAKLGVRNRNQAIARARELGVAPEHD